jgi:hypothetical protein
MLERLAHLSLGREETRGVILTCPKSGHVDHALHAHGLGTLADLCFERKVETEIEGGVSECTTQSTGRNVIAYEITYTMLERSVRSLCLYHAVPIMLYIHE